VLFRSDAAPRRSSEHVLVNVVDPANVWGPVFALTRPDGTKIAAPRVPTSWLILRAAGLPVVLAEGRGRELTSLAGCAESDWPGVAHALGSAVDRAAAVRPVRRLEVATCDGRPIGDTPAADSLRAAGFVVAGPRLVREPAPARR